MVRPAVVAMARAKAAMTLGIVKPLVQEGEPGQGPGRERGMLGRKGSTPDLCRYALRSEFPTCSPPVFLTEIVTLRNLYRQVCLVVNML